VELFPLFEVRRVAQTRREIQRKTVPGEGVKLMKIAAAKPVVPIVSLHKFG
jgi:hypothetical protein